MKFNLELEYFASELGPTGSDEDRKRAKSKECDDNNTTDEDGLKRRYQMRNLFNETI